ncbi:MAG TPA: SpoVG family protein [Thermoguttaceae bacterium]|nr:SpoVG family protein [Thermoguttaceae bacterium]
MDITEVRIKLMDEPGERLKAFCSITFDDCFVVRDLKIIEGASGPFVAMPSRKLTAHCPSCRGKNHLRAAHCNQCGARLKETHAAKDDEGRAKLYADIAHPINSACREMIQARVIQAFMEEKERAAEPGYISCYEDLDSDVGLAEGPTTLPVDRTEVQQAEPPHGPHTAPARQGRPANRPRRRDFGAGIFE